MPFTEPIDTKSHEVLIPKKITNLALPSQINTTDNFPTATDKKISTDHAYKIGEENLNGDVISVPKDPLAADFAILPLLQYQRSSRTTQWFEIKNKHAFNIKDLPRDC